MASPPVHSTGLRMYQGHHGLYILRLLALKHNIPREGRLEMQLNSHYDRVKILHQQYSHSGPRYQYKSSSWPLSD